MANKSRDTSNKRSTNGLPSKKQRQIVKAKIKGHSNAAIGAMAYPNAAPQSQRQLVSRELNKSHVAQYMEQGKLIALKEHNITWSRIIRPINDALNADKQNQFTGEITPDHTIRLSAAKAARDLIQAKDIQDNPAPILNIPADADTIEILRAWKSPPPNA